MSITIVCPNGHKLKVKDKYAGKSGLCPTCKARIKVPVPKPRGIDDDAIMDILRPETSGLSIVTESEIRAAAEADGKWSAKEKDVVRLCGKCHAEVAEGTSVCPNCHTYIATLSD